MVQIVVLAALLLSNPVPMERVGRVTSPDCSDVFLVDVIECVHREFIEDDSRRGPAVYYLGCVADTAGGFSDPTDSYLERLADADAPVLPYSEWTPAPPHGDVSGADEGPSVIRHVRCGVLRLTWYPENEGLAMLHAEGAVQDTTLFAVGLILRDDGQWTAGVF